MTDNTTIPNFLCNIDMRKKRSASRSLFEFFIFDNKIRKLPRTLQVIHKELLYPLSFIHLLNIHNFLYNNPKIPGDPTQNKLNADRESDETHQSRHHI